VVDIFDEVSEDLRHDQAVALGKRYGSYLIGAMLAVLVGVGAQQYWEYHQAQQADAAATQYLALTQTVDATGTSIDAPTAQSAAQALASFATTAPEGYKTLADLRAAALYAGAGQPTQAEALWDQTSADQAADPLLRDLATLLWAQHALGTVADQDVMTRLAPLTQSTNPYHALALETQAYAALHAGDTAQAKALLSQLNADTNVPPGVRNRAQLMLAKLNG
jgi:hypothetical protein